MNRGLKANLTFDFVQNQSLSGALGLTGWNPVDWPVAPDWRGVVDTFVNSATGSALGRFIQTRIDQGAEVYPPQPLRALAFTPLADVSVVILGQDPYHGPGQAEGLSFSVPAGVKPPPSLRNIQKELQRDLGLPPPSDGSLIRWARQGVMLLNTCLTVEKEQPASHAGAGWEALTDELIKTVYENGPPVVFMLWGAHAQGKRALLASPSGRAGGQERHLVLCSNHPSPLSALRPPNPFIGCGHFSRANEFLRRWDRRPIVW
jgi:uracil-DNA glycosylase